ncbi:MAG: PEP-CTERM sorting domain-containing protein [Gammaproteobacteria bacterium]|nr:PEP-CTERM sorting domain-containing protein [Gammaproteobacteria bacterium]
MLCNNDVIEGGVSVPEPGSLALFGLGLGGLLARRARQRHTTRTRIT